MDPGIWYAVGAYALWGVLPIYWKWLSHVPAPELIAHRVIWSFLTLLLVGRALGRRRNLWELIADRRVARVYGAAALLLSVNWLTYVWGVNAGYIVETSLGYFINPLVSVVLGVVFFRVRLRPLQWVAVALATVGVLYLTFGYGWVPWIALVLATSFALYGLIKKAAPLDPFDGLLLETGILFLPAVGYLIRFAVEGSSALLGSGAPVPAKALTVVLLVGAGALTTAPLLSFATATKRIPLSTVGMLQYITPTLQFLIGVLIYNEPFPLRRFIGFGIVWAALALLGFEGAVARWKDEEGTNPEGSPA
jgi:chloramphenicol-sensitive protein RarD